MDSLAAAPPVTPTERRLKAEWALLSEIIALNPARFGPALAVDTTFYVTLDRTPALALDAATVIQGHRLRVVFPRYFPALPLELYLETPVFHPNIHPETGFVCLWDQHRTANTVEHALHKTAAILGWRLLNLEPMHTMQKEAAAVSERERDILVETLHAEPLRGTLVSAGATGVRASRRRLT